MQGSQRADLALVEGTLEEPAELLECAHYDHPGGLRPLAESLNLPVIAEGVESAEQLAFLARESCDEVQGFLIGRPAPIEEYAASIGRKAVPKLKLISA